MADTEDYKFALSKIDDLILLFPDYNAFSIDKVVEKSNLQHFEKILISRVKWEIENLLVEKFRYAYRDLTGVLSLTDLGREVKEKGGHQKYLAHIESEKRQYSHRQKLEDQKTELEINLSRKVLRDYPTTKLMAIFGFIITVILLVLELINFFRQK